MLGRGTPVPQTEILLPRSLEVEVEVEVVKEETEDPELSLLLCNPSNHCERILDTIAEWM
jgi:hypothetical protein